MTNGSENELLFEAAVSDEGFIEFMERLETHMDRMAIAAEEGFEKVDKRIDKSAKKMGIMAGAVAALTNKFIELGFQAFAGVKNFVSSSIQLAARLDVLETVLARVGTQAGYTEDELARFEEGVKSNGITTEATRQSILLMIRANIDLEHAFNLSRIAQNAGVIANMDSSQAFERLILGIQKGEPELLDELQITLDRERAYDSLSQQLGVNKKELTELQKQEAIIQDIYRQSVPIIGVYDDSMGDVGKQAGSLVRHMDTLKETLGRAFQPAYTEQIRFMGDVLKDLNTWLEENQEGVEEFEDAITGIAKVAFPLLELAVQKLLDIPGTIKGVGVGLAEIINNIFGLMSQEELEKRADNLTKYFKDALLIVATLFVGFVSTAINLVVFTARAIKALFSVEDWEEFARNVEYQWGVMSENIRLDMLNAGTDMRESLYGVEEAAEGVTEELEGMAKAAVDIGLSPVAAVTQVEEALKKLHDEIEEGKAKRALKASRDVTERALRDSWRRQDIERKFQDSIDDIDETAQEKREGEEKSYQETRQEAAKGHSDDLIEIEQNYQDRLRDIQEDFEFNAGEFARKRDAVGLLRLIRQKNREEKKADDARKKSKGKANKSYEEQLKDIKKNFKKIQKEIEDSVKKQLKALEEARDEDYENYERSLKRQQDIRDLHEQWAQEDRDVAEQKKFDDLMDSFGKIEGLTASSLARMLEYWDGYFGDTKQAMADFMFDMLIAQGELMGGMFPTAEDIYESDWYKELVKGGGGGGDGEGTPGDPNYVPPTPRGGPPEYEEGWISEYGDWLREYWEPWEEWLKEFPNLNPLIALDADLSKQFKDQGGWFPSAPLINTPDNPYDPYRNPEKWYRWESENNPNSVFLGPRQESNSSITGQSGQVSSLLADAFARGIPTLTIPQEPARIGPVSPSSTTDRREIHITADLLGVDPYVQQVVINSMLEIERNRGGS